MIINFRFGSTRLIRLQHVTLYIRYDSVYLTCSKKLRGSQLSPPHGTNRKLKCETKNKTMSMIGPVQSHCHEGSPVITKAVRYSFCLII